MARGRRDKGFKVGVLDVHGILESYTPNRTGSALGFEIEGTPLSVKGPDVLDVVSKSTHELRGSLKHSPGRYVGLASCNSKHKASFCLNR